MEKTMTLNLRVNPEVKKNAEEVLSQLGMSMSKSMNTDEMTAKEIRALLQEGLDDINAGKVQDASEAFAKFRESL